MANANVTSVNFNPAIAVPVRSSVQETKAKIKNLLWLMINF